MSAGLEISAEPSEEGHLTQSEMDETFLQKRKEGRVVKGQAFQEKRKIKAKRKEHGAECCMPVTCSYCQDVKCVCMTGMATSQYLANRWGQVKEEGVSSVRSFILQTLGSQQSL